VLLCFVDPRVRKIRNEVISVVGEGTEVSLGLFMSLQKLRNNF